jgi:hypothetical protein
VINSLVVKIINGTTDWYLPAGYKYWRAPFSLESKENQSFIINGVSPLPAITVEWIS